MNNKKERWIEMTSRDRRIMELMARFRCMYLTTILILAGFLPNYGRKRISKLVRCAYLDKSVSRYNLPAIYSATAKGLSEAGIGMRTYSIENDQAVHEAVVAEVAAWLHLKYGIPLSEILSERDQKATSPSADQYPDLIVKSQKLAVEYEKTPKTTSALAAKIEANSQYEQLWVLEEKHLNSLGKRISTICKDSKAKYSSPYRVAIVTRESIEQEINDLWEKTRLEV